MLYNLKLPIFQSNSVVDIFYVREIMYVFGFWFFVCASVRRSKGARVCINVPKKYFKFCIFTELSVRTGKSVTRDLHLKWEQNLVLNITNDQIKKGKWEEDWMEVRKVGI